jgi:hypothetical protein
MGLAVPPDWTTCKFDPAWFCISANGPKQRRYLRIASTRRVSATTVRSCGRVGGIRAARYLQIDHGHVIATLGQWNAPVSKRMQSDKFLIRLCRRSARSSSVWRRDCGRRRRTNLPCRPLQDGEAFGQGGLRACCRGCPGPTEGSWSTHQPMLPPAAQADRWVAVSVAALLPIPTKTPRHAARVRNRWLRAVCGPQPAIFLRLSPRAAPGSVDV